MNTINGESRSPRGGFCLAALMEVVRRLFDCITIRNGLGCLVSIIGSRSFMNSLFRSPLKMMISYQIERSTSLSMSDCFESRELNLGPKRAFFLEFRWHCLFFSFREAERG